MPYVASERRFGPMSDEVDRLALNLRQRILALRDQSALGDTPRQAYLQIMRAIGENVAIMEAHDAIPGFSGFVTSEKSYNYNTQYGPMRDALNAVADWIDLNVPEDDTNWPRDGSEPTPKVMTTAETAGYRTLADTVGTAIT